MMDKLEQSQQKTVEVAKEALSIAERRGLTLAETMGIPNIMNNIIYNELRQKEIPYKRGQPQERNCING